MVYHQIGKGSTHQTRYIVSQGKIQKEIKSSVGIIIIKATIKLI